MNINNNGNLHHREVLGADLASGIIFVNDGAGGIDRFKLFMDATGALKAKPYSLPPIDQSGESGLSQAQMMRNVDQG